MKGAIPDCLGKLISSKYGEDKWKDCLLKAGKPRSANFMPTHDLPDGDVFQMIKCTCSVLKISIEELADISELVKQL